MTFEFHSHSEGKVLLGDVAGDHRAVHDGGKGVHKSAARRVVRAGAQVGLPLVNKCSFLKVN